MADYLTVLTTTDSADAAAALARSAVTARLAACAQVDGPITSTYWWRGAVESAQEWRVLYKTTAERYPQLEAHIKAEHSYDTPEVIVGEIPVGSREYLDWITEETRQS
jgi:periplasmic divalent cation tolerance protein